MKKPKFLEDYDLVTIGIVLLCLYLVICTIMWAFLYAHKPGCKKEITEDLRYEKVCSDGIELGPLGKILFFPTIIIPPVLDFVWNSFKDLVFVK